MIASENLTGAERILGLRCVLCNNLHPDCDPSFDCPACGGFTQVAYDLPHLRSTLDRDAIAGAPGRLWRWRDLLPVHEADSVVTLGEGATPLLPSRRIGPALGLDHLYFKDLTRNPTGSFKDYSASVSVSKARELGVPGIVLMSAGNASSAFAAYCAVAGIPFQPLMLPITTGAMVVQNLIFGARGIVVDGTSAVAGSLAGRLARERGWMDAGVPHNPYRAEGKKVIAFEIALDLGWSVPDRIICPTAGGTSIMALAKGFAELNALGWVDGTPRLDCVQHETCAPVVTAWREHAPARAATDPRSIAIGLLAPNPAAAPLLVQHIDDTQGAGETVTDDEIRAAQRRLAQEEGLFVEPSSAAALAGLLKLHARGALRRDETIVLMLTGSGLKATEHVAVERPVVVADFEALSNAVP